jgi:carboxynorspermidine decarboxylase
MTMQTNGMVGNISNRIGDVASPAFVFDELSLLASLHAMQGFAASGKCRALFSVKSLAISDVLVTIARSVDGFSASSLFETKLARDIGGQRSLVSYIGPILRDHELNELESLCDRITINSLSQLDRFAGRLAQECEIGIRLNPGVSFVEDPRYDPCRRDSKLGVPLERFRAALRSEPDRFANVSGIHFHSNCDSENTDQLIATIRQVESVLGDDLRRFRWLNVGGGYLFNDSCAVTRAVSEFHRVRERYGLEIVVEPGAAIVRSAGTIVATVEDIVEGDQQPIAILDTTVNHWPEVFEYQFEPDVEGHVDDGQFTYLLAGCSCLAGDLFGVYSFNAPLEVGSRVVFRNAGAYSIVKAHMFNGINLPNIYSLTEAGELVLVKRFTYEDFASRCGVDAHAVV